MGMSGPMDTSQWEKRLKLKAKLLVPATLGIAILCLYLAVIFDAPDEVFLAGGIFFLLAIIATPIMAIDYHVGWRTCEECSTRFHGHCPNCGWAPGAGYRGAAV